MFTDSAWSTTPSDGNELYIDRDIMVLANPEIARLPDWVVALVAAGAGRRPLGGPAARGEQCHCRPAQATFMPQISEQGELIAARLSAAAAVLVAGYFGVNPPGFVAQVVAFAFGLAASSFFPAIVLGIFWKRANREGVVAGMLVGIVFTASYIVYFKFLGGTADGWWWGISPEGIGTVGMLLNALVAVVVSSVTPPPPEHVQQMVERIRIPSGADGPSAAH